MSTDQGVNSSPYLTAAQAAARLQVTREWVYDHAVELGVIRLGTGTRGRMRFQREELDRIIMERQRTIPVEPRRKPGRPRVQHRRTRTVWKVEGLR
jgi:hypothetical protein